MSTLCHDCDFFMTQMNTASLSDFLHVRTLHNADFWVAHTLVCASGALTAWRGIHAG
jgi:hypothetical protein